MTDIDLKRNPVPRRLGSENGGGYENDDCAKANRHRQGGLPLAGAKRGVARPKSCDPTGGNERCQGANSISPGRPMARK